jgi:ribosomal protein S18 acetylase RimI-like enzyme
MEEGFVIREMTISDINVVASIHLKELGESFLGKMGDRFLKRLYSCMLEEQSFKGFVAENRLGIHGFATITLDSAQFYKRVYKKHFFSLATDVILRGIRQTPLILKSFQIFFSKTPCINIKAELLSIAVSKDYRGQGIGRMLVNAILSFLKSRDKDSIFVLVDSHIPANDFYKSLGFIDNGQIRLHRDIWSLYWIKAK